jgi:hypothetical protein
LSAWLRWEFAASLLDWTAPHLVFDHSPGFVRSLQSSVGCFQSGVCHGFAMHKNLKKAARLQTPNCQLPTDDCQLYNTLPPVTGHEHV